MLGDLAVAYLFLGGTGAGVCLVAASLSLCSPGHLISRIDASRKVGRPRTGGVSWGSDPLRTTGASRAKRRLALPPAYRRLFASLGLAGTAVLALGAVCLLADLGSLDRFEQLFLTPRLTFVTVGAWSIGFCLLLGCAFVAMAAVNVPVPLWAMRLVAALLAAMSCVVMVYTGLLLQSVAAVALWTSFWLPVLFFLSSLSCGLALAAAVGEATGSTEAFPRTFRSLSRTDVAVIVLEAATLAFYLAAALNVGWPGSLAVEAGTPTAEALAESAWLLTAGPQAWVLWAGFVVVGLAVPLAAQIALLAAQRRRSIAWVLHGAVVFGGSLCVLVGGVALRYAVTVAAVLPSIAMPT